MTPFEGIYEVIVIVSTIVSALAFLGFLFDTPKTTYKLLGGIYIAAVLICQTKLLLVMYA